MRRSEPISPPHRIRGAVAKFCFDADDVHYRKRVDGMKVQSFEVEIEVSEP